MKIDYNVEEAICKNPDCKRNFKRKKKRSHSSHLPNVRKVGCVTCSPKCSRAYNKYLNSGKNENEE